MRRLALASIIGFLTLSSYNIATALAAYSNASIAGPFACIGSGFTLMNDAHGASTWVPSTSLGQVTNDESGGFVGSITSNTAGLVCSGKINGTGTINPDGTGSGTANLTPAASNPAQCPNPGPLRSISVIVSRNSFYLIGATPGSTGWTLCTRQTH